LQEFFQELAMSPLLPRPVPEILLLSHASETGWLEMPLTDETQNEVQFETFPKTGTALQIPEAILKDNANVVRPAIVRIKGCRIGIALPFMTKMKEVLKNVSSLVAPKHFQGFGRWWDDEGNTIARTEWLSYCFESYSIDFDKTTVSQDNMIKALKTDKHKFYDNSAVPDDQWKTWFKRVQVPPQVKSDTKFGENIKFLIQMPTSSNSTEEGDLIGALRVSHEIRIESGPWVIGKGKPKANQNVRRNFVKGILGNPANKSEFPVCFADHKWPIWQRYLKARYNPFSSLDDFMKGFDWFSEIEGSWMGRRNRFRVIAPIIKSGTQNTLLANYYPIASTPAYVGLEEKDGPLFAVV
jgi:hypothetical protein